MDDGLLVKLHGTAGSVPVTGRPHFGGATACFEVCTNGTRCIMDAGSGIIPLGQELIKKPKALGENDSTIHIIFSHAHFDHIQGLPFFAPLYDERFSVTVWSAKDSLDVPFEQALMTFFASPLCSVRRDHIRAKFSFCEMNLDGPVEIATSVFVEALALNHPGGNAAFRITSEGTRIVYSGDFEHDHGPLDAALANFMAEADLALLDCSYTPENYDHHKGFGHSHWLRAGEIAAKAKRWLGIHHNHLASDGELDLIDQALRKAYPNGALGKDGMTITL